MTAAEERWNNELVQATSRGDISEVKHCLRFCTNINYHDKYGWTALHYAVDKEFEPIIILLLHSRANLEAVDKKQQTVLHCAAKNGKDRIVHKLLEFGAKVDGMTKKDERTALHMAADFGHGYVASILLANGANVNIQDKYMNTPLHLAAQRGFEKVTNMLLQHRANPNIVNEDGWTALHYAAWKGFDMVVMALLDNKANYSIKDSTQQTALDVATKGNRVRVMKILTDFARRKPIAASMSSSGSSNGGGMAYLPGNSAFMNSSSSRDIVGLGSRSNEMLYGQQQPTQLVTHAALTQSMLSQQPPMHPYMSPMGQIPQPPPSVHPYATQLQPHLQANLHPYQTPAKHPFQTHAQSHPYQTTLNTLQSMPSTYPIPPNQFMPTTAVNTNQLPQQPKSFNEPIAHNPLAKKSTHLIPTPTKVPTPSSSAAAGGNTSKLAPVINYNEELRTVAMQGESFRIQFYVSKGANVNYIDADGWTPLHHAVYHGHRAVIDELLKYDVDLTLKTKDGWTATQWAEKRSLSDVARKLKVMERSQIVKFTSESYYDNVSKLARLLEMQDKNQVVVNNDANSSPFPVPMIQVPYSIAYSIDELFRLGNELDKQDETACKPIEMTLMKPLILSLKDKTERALIRPDLLLKRYNERIENCWKECFLIARLLMSTGELNHPPMSTNNPGTSTAVTTKPDNKPPGMLVDAHYHQMLSHELNALTGLWKVTSSMSPIIAIFTAEGLIKQEHITNGYCGIPIIRGAGCKAFYDLESSSFSAIEAGMKGTTGKSLIEDRKNIGVFAGVFAEKLSRALTIKYKDQLLAFQQFPTATMPLIGKPDPFRHKQLPEIKDRVMKGMIKITERIKHFCKQKREHFDERKFVDFSLFHYGKDWYEEEWMAMDHLSICIKSILSLTPTEVAKWKELLKEENGMDGILEEMIAKVEVEYPTHLSMSSGSNEKKSSDENKSVTTGSKTSSGNSGISTLSSGTAMDKAAVGVSTISPVTNATRVLIPPPIVISHPAGTTPKATNGTATVPTKTSTTITPASVKSPTPPVPPPRPNDLPSSPKSNKKSTSPQAQAAATTNTKIQSPSPSPSSVISPSQSPIAAVKATAATTTVVKTDNNINALSAISAITAPKPSQTMIAKPVAVTTTTTKPVGKPSVVSSLTSPTIANIGGKSAAAGNNKFNKPVVMKKQSLHENQENTPPVTGIKTSEDAVVIGLTREKIESLLPKFLTAEQLETLRNAPTVTDTATTLSPSQGLRKKSITELPIPPLPPADAPVMETRKYSELLVNVVDQLKEEQEEIVKEYYRKEKKLKMEILKRDLCIQQMTVQLDEQKLTIEQHQQLLQEQESSFKDKETTLEQDLSQLKRAYSSVSVRIDKCAVINEGSSSSVGVGMESNLSGSTSTQATTVTNNSTSSMTTTTSPPTSPTSRSASPQHSKAAKKKFTEDVRNQLLQEMQVSQQIPRQACIIS